MESALLKKAKKCCSREYDRLVENLSNYERYHRNRAERHWYYRVTAKVSGRRSKKCILGE
jgi:hypothetical protein